MNEETKSQRLDGARALTPLSCLFEGDCDFRASEQQKFPGIFYRGQSPASLIRNGAWRASSLGKESPGSLVSLSPDEAEGLRWMQQDRETGRGKVCCRPGAGKSCAKGKLAVLLYPLSSRYEVASWQVTAFCGFLWLPQDPPMTLLCSSLP